MAAKICRQHSLVFEKLFSNPTKFNFFQGLRLLNHYCQQKNLLYPIGYGHSSLQETIRLHTLPMITFSTNSLVKIRRQENPLTQSDVIHVFISFFGLIGPNGTLPSHYTTLILERIRQHDFAMIDFLDIFHHRFLSLYYLAWEYNRLPILYEKLQNNSQNSAMNPNTAIMALTGISLDNVTHNQVVSEEMIIHYCGLYAAKFRPLYGLQQLLCGYFKIPIKIFSYEPCWIAIQKDEYSILTAQTGGFHSLGVNTLLGKKVMDTFYSFKVMITPKNDEQFMLFLPTSKYYMQLRTFIHFYIRPHLKYKIQIDINENISKKTTLQSSKTFHLGWNTWLTSKYTPKTHKAA